MMQRALSSVVKNVTTKSNKKINSSALFVLGGTAGGAVSGAAYAKSASKNRQNRNTKDYKGTLLYDIALNDKLVIIDEKKHKKKKNNDGDDNNTEQDQIFSVAGSSSAVTLYWDSKPTSAIAQHKVVQQDLLDTTSLQSPQTRPLRLAISSSGTSKELCDYRRNHLTGQNYWTPNNLENFAMRGEDIEFKTGEDAVISGHIGQDNDTRFEYIPIDNHNLKALRELLDCADAEEQIEHIRLQKAGKGGLDKYKKKADSELFAEQADPVRHKTKPLNLLFLEQHPQDESIQFRHDYVAKNPELRQKLLTPEEKRQRVEQLKSLLPPGYFVHRALPLPVVTPLHSYTQDHKRGVNPTPPTTTIKKANDFRTLPLTTRAVIGVSDGVGGMAEYGGENETKEFSHQLLSMVRHSLTNSTKTARELLGQAYVSLIANNTITLGSATAAIGMISIAPPSPQDELVDEFDDGRRLALSIANAGDSTILAFRPKLDFHGGRYFEPIVLSWPLHHPSNTNNPAPCQLSIYHNDRRTTAFPPSHKRVPEKYTTLSTSHYATPTPDGLQNLNGPSGGNRVFISCKDYRGLIAGKVLLTDLVARHPHQNNQQIKAFPQTKLDRINNNELRHSDQPWMSQGMDGVTLQRGDVVCAFSDGVGDNLSRETLDDIYNLWSNTVGYMHPAIRVQHPATRNVKPIAPNMMKPGDLDQYHSVKDILKVTEVMLNRFPKDGQLETFNNQLNPNTALVQGGFSPYSGFDIPGERRPITDPVQQALAFQHYQLQGFKTVKYQSTLTDQEEGIIAGSLAAAFAGQVIRYSQGGPKCDDLSVVVGVVY